MSEVKKHTLVANENRNRTWKMRQKDRAVDKEVEQAFARLFPTQHGIFQYQHSFFL